MLYKKEKTTYISYMSFSLISFHYPFTVYLLQSLQSLKHLHLIIIEILPVLIDSTAILKSVA